MAAFIQRADGSYVYFDLTDEEQHEGTAIVTDYPVEDGPNVSDHMRTQLTPFKMRCTISNSPIMSIAVWGKDVRGGATKTMTLKDTTPYVEPTSVTSVIANPIGTVIGAVGSLLSGKPKDYTIPTYQFSSQFDAVADMITALTDMQESNELVNVTTSKKVYNGVVLEHFELVRNRETGDGAEVDLMFKRLRIVSSKAGATPTPTESRGASPKDKGAQGMAPASDADKTSLAGHATGYHD